MGKKKKLKWDELDPRTTNNNAKMWHLCLHL